MVKVIVDCFGGDLSPAANVEGAVLALQQFPDLEIILTGDEDLLKQELAGKTFDADRLSIVHAPEVIGVNEKPTLAVRTKKESSLMKGIRMLREEEEIAGLVSTGSTGAVVAGAIMRIGRLKNVIRPAFCPVMTDLHGGLVAVCDSGANVDIKPDQLQQQAIMGTVYLQEVFGIENPRVGLLNIGVEEEKGDELRKQAYQLLQETEGINFVGNMEAREFLSGDYDLVVCDGFSGNVLLKSTEGACMQILKLLKRDIEKSFLYKIGALFLLKLFKQEKELMNYQNYGGSVLLGANKVIVKGHGSSNPTAVCKCIEQVYRAQTGGMNARIEAMLPEYVKKSE